MPKQNPITFETHEEDFGRPGIVQVFTVKIPLVSLLALGVDEMKLLKMLHDGPQSTSGALKSLTRLVEEIERQQRS